MRRLSFVALALVMIPFASHAQIGGRIRSTVTGAVTGQQQQKAAAGATQLVVIPITPEVVASYEKALAARQLEMQRMARENSPTGRYFAARLARDSAARRRHDFESGVGPDYQRAQQLQAAMMQGDANASTALTRLHTEVNGDEPDLPQTDWNAQQSANAHLDSIMMEGAGMSAGEWAYTNDVMLKLVNWTANSAVGEDTVVQRIAQSAQVTAAEVRAVGARRIELARALAQPYETDAELAAANQPALDPAASADPNARYNACQQTEMKPIMDEAERRKTELETAAKNNDTTKLMDFANRMVAAQQAATLKCAPLLEQ